MIYILSGGALVMLRESIKYFLINSPKEAIFWAKFLKIFSSLIFDLDIVECQGDGVHLLVRHHLALDLVHFHLCDLGGYALILAQVSWRFQLNRWFWNLYYGLESLTVIHRGLSLARQIQMIVCSFWSRFEYGARGRFFLLLRFVLVDLDLHNLWLFLRL